MLSDEDLLLREAAGGSLENLVVVFFLIDKTRAISADRPFLHCTSQNAYFLSGRPWRLAILRKVLCAYCQPSDGDISHLSNHLVYRFHLAIRAHDLTRR